MTHSSPTEAVAAEVRAHLARRRISQAAAAGRIGIAQASMSRRLAGLSPFTVDELYLLAEMFDVDAAELVPTPPQSKASA